LAFQRRWAEADFHLKTRNKAQQGEPIGSS
jgi:hypothetical protein